MLNKIDKKILDKISVLGLKKNIDVIIYSNKYYETRDNLNKIYYKNLIELPFVSCFAITTNISNLYQLADLKSVEYICGDVKVSSLIYNSKKFINSNILESQISKSSVHACVVIDTGIYPHIDFCLGKNRVIKFVDLINQSNTMYDDNGHGTFITSILCGNSICDKYSGVDNNCNIIVIKALDSVGETSSGKILEAMQWVLDNKQKFNIKIVCMSFGSVLQDLSDPLIYGAEILWDNGIVVVSAAGNSGPNESTIMSPGGSRKIITVGALDNIKLTNLKVASFSSRGPVFSYYKPDMLLPGVEITGADVYSGSKKFYTTMSGTSVSTPMVAGTVSLMFSINPNYTPNQIKYMLINSCVKITGDRNSEGYGYLDLSKLILL